MLIVGTGPSLKGFDFQKLNALRAAGGCYILAVKEAIEDLPGADAVFGLDLPWMHRRRERLEALARKIPVYLAVPEAQEDLNVAEVEGATYLKRFRSCERFREDAGEIEAGGNSGFGALNVAYHKRSSEVFLFGFDYSKNHYCDDRYSHQPLGHNVRYWSRWATNFDATIPQLEERGVKVWNVSPNSNVAAFQKISHDRALAQLGA